MNIFMLRLNNNTNGKDEIIFADNYTPTGKGVWISFEKHDYELKNREIKDVQNLDVNPVTVSFNAQYLEILTEADK